MTADSTLPAADGERPKWMDTGVWNANIKKLQSSMEEAMI